MTFQIKDFASIVAAEINHARGVTSKITDYLPGSVARTLLEAPAVEMEELYIQMLLGLRDAIPTAVFKSFGFDKLPAAYAYGFVSISLTTAPSVPFLIPLGTVFSTSDGRGYISTQAMTWGAGATVVRVPVMCSVAGAVGNVSAGAIVSTTLAGSGYTVSNSAITTGRDAESDSDREARFAEYVASLSRGTLIACSYAVKSASLLDADGNASEYVARVGVDEQRGYVAFYVYSNAGVASAGLVAQAQKLIDGYTTDAGVVVPGYRAAGIPIEVFAMAERSIALSIQVGMYPGYDMTNAVQQSISDLFGSTLRAVQPGTTLYLKELIESMLAVPGVRVIVPLSTENLACAAGEALVPGVLSISAL